MVKNHVIDCWIRSFGLALVPLLCIAGWFVFGFGNGRASPGDVVLEGKTIQLDCGLKLEAIIYRERRPVAVLRLMRPDEQPTVYILKPVDLLSDEHGPNVAAPAIIIKECR